MKVLNFEPKVPGEGEHRVRRARFEERSLFTVPAACVIANAVRETLARALSDEVELRLFEPLVPDASGWSAVACDARVYRVEGSSCDAAIVIRPSDALALSAGAFGEYRPRDGDVSPLESRALDRVVEALALALGSVCGRVGRVFLQAAGLERFATYFEVQIERPFSARLGVALASDPAPARPGETVPADALLGVEVELAVRTPGVAVPARALASIQPGAIVPITENTGGMTAVLSFAGRPLASGECGVRGNRLALAIGLTPHAEGSSEPES